MNENTDVFNALTWLGGVTPSHNGEQKSRDLRSTLSFNPKGYRENVDLRDRIYIPNVSCI